MLKPRASSLFMKTTHGAAMTPVNELALIAGGIVGDVCLSADSPRQVLIVRQDDLNQFFLPEGYLRENIVVSGLSVEAFKPGAMITFESGARVHLTFYCEPCKKIADRVSRLSDLHRRRGILGVVLREGMVATGAKLEIGLSPLQEMSDEPRHRVHMVISAIPKGRVIDYATLLHAAGLQRPYFRVMPKYIESAFESGLPAHRVVDSGGTSPSVVKNSFDLLRTELSGNDHRLATQADFFDGVPECMWVAPDSIRWTPNMVDLLTIK